MAVSLATILRKPGDTRAVITGTVVSSVAAPTSTAVVDIDGAGGRITAPYVGSQPAAGDVAVMVRSGRGLWIVGVFGATVTVPPVTDPDEGTDTGKPPPPPTTTTVTLRPTATGTARNGSVRGDTSQLYQGDWTGRGRNSGQAVYKARQLSGTVTSCQLRIKRLDAGVYAAQAPTLRLMTQSSLTGSPTWQQSQPGPGLAVGQTATVTLPVSWGQALINGTAGGIGIHVDANSPYVRLAGKAEGFMSVTLTIKE